MAAYEHIPAHSTSLRALRRLRMGESHTLCITTMVPAWRMVDRRCAITRAEAWVDESCRVDSRRSMASYATVRGSSRGRGHHSDDNNACMHNPAL